MSVHNAVLDPAEIAALLAGISALEERFEKSGFGGRLSFRFGRYSLWSRSSLLGPLTLHDHSADGMAESGFDWM